ncbi:acetolactate decarboxylase [Rhizobium sp. BK251]|uniref:acetolactate decarboxylase n=1 Tax=Rhizobium sp. BK251 TaxID=2512125 RepID=UPI001046004F|nr:acetolactate decarboxylase [Rhizobium sp. BK251]TCL73987.1 acetolactate decarboxylase [Rhizobium sp. BK251]
MPTLSIDIPASLLSTLTETAERDGTDTSSVISAALAQYLGTSYHTLFQVSTSGALVAGVYDGVLSVGSILDHGDFGLGTFANLDGEMVILDGRAHQVHGDGRVEVAGVDARAPFAVVTRLRPTSDTSIEAVSDMKGLEAHCDALRKSGNIFYAFRLDGHFSSVRARAVNPQQPGARLIDAAKAQSEFHFSDIGGTLVGLWSPGFSSAFSVPGYHFHFLSDDRKHGGHLLDCAASSLRLRMEALTDFHLALPESRNFLAADLSKNTAGELAYAEQAH